MRQPACVVKANEAKQLRRRRQIKVIVDAQVPCDANATLHIECMAVVVCCDVTRWKLARKPCKIDNQHYPDRTARPTSATLSPHRVIYMRGIFLPGMMDTTDTDCDLIEQHHRVMGKSIRPLCRQHFAH